MDMRIEEFSAERLGDIAQRVFHSDPFDFLDPRTWEMPVHRDDDTCYICLSDRWDLHVAVDRIDYDYLRQFLWCHTYGSGDFAKRGKIPTGVEKLYARRSIPIPGVTPSGRPRYGSQWLHRVVTERAYGPPPSILHVSDHLDGNSLNCKRNNLRWATLSQNAKNKFGEAWLQKRFNFGSGYSE